MNAKANTQSLMLKFIKEVQTKCKSRLLPTRSESKSKSMKRALFVILVYTKRNRINSMAQHKVQENVKRVKRKH
jgi:hypothetical protein